jgi:hypothetical protein
MVHCGLSQLHRCTRIRLRANARDSDGVADLRRFSQLLEDTEHFCGCGQEKVAKIVHCGENYFLVVEQEATREMASSFCAIEPSN